ncbi:MAG TPA: type II secretion system secretin GspD [Usitatibacteraceae bacterium]|jgi:general secretion pathway protein D|nr:type II secretion system secretin GspD [Usitatibacteraceae bacterium]
MNPFPRAVTPLVAALAVAGCAALPGAPQDAAPAVVTTPAPARPAAPAAAAAEAATEKSRVFPGSGIFVKNVPSPPPVAGPEEVSLNFEATEIRQVAATILGDILRESFTVHPQVQGTVSLRTVKPIPRKDVLATLEMLLRQNGAALVREDAMYKIVPTAVAARGSVTPQLGAAGAPLRPGFNIVIAPVKFIGAKEMAKLLEPFVVDQSVVRVDEVRNLLILQGTQRELKHLLETIDLFDVDFLAGMSVGLFPLQGADVKALVADMDKVFGPQAAGPLAGVVRVIPVERLNALLIVTTQPHYLKVAQTWIERLDRAGGATGGTRIHVYPVQNGKAENLASLLSEIFSGKTSAPPAAPSLAPGSRPAQIQSPTLPGQPAAAAPTPAAPATPLRTSFEGDGAMVSKDVRVIADKDNNALVILASPGDYEKIEAAIKKLDVVPRQVLIEVLIAEVTLTDELQYGVDWFINARSGLSMGGSGVLEPNVTRGSLNMGTLPTSPTSPVPALASGGLQLINTLGGDVRGVLTAIGKDSRLRIVSSPTLMVIDNQKAKIQVGDKVPTLSSTQTGVTTGTGVISNVNYLDTGVLLTVTPRVNSGGRITLEILQEVSAASKTESSTIDSPTLTQRSAQSVVTTQSGETLVFGGMIRTERTFGTTGLPLLSKIPVVGGLFGNQVYTDKRTELILLITPKLIADVTQAREALDEIRRKMPGFRDLIPKKDAEPVAPK